MVVVFPMISIGYGSRPRPLNYLLLLYITSDRTGRTATRRNKKMGNFSYLYRNTDKLFLTIYFLPLFVNKISTQLDQIWSKLNISIEICKYNNTNPSIIAAMNGQILGVK